MKFKLMSLGLGVVLSLAILLFMATLVEPPRGEKASSEQKAIVINMQTEVNEVQVRERPVRGVRLLRLDRFAPHVIEAENEIGVAFECLGRRDILDAMLFPQPASVAEGVDAAFGRDAGAGQDDDILHSSPRLEPAISPTLFQAPFRRIGQ